MSPHDRVDMAFTAVGALSVATWMLLSAWASVALGDAVREHGGSRRASKVATRATFLVLGIGGAVVIQAIAL